jgi:hypothetical protein
MTYIRDILLKSDESDRIADGLIALFCVYNDSKMPHTYFTEVLLSALENDTIKRNDVFKLVYHLKERNMFEIADYVASELAKKELLEKGLAEN